MTTGAPNEPTQYLTFRVGGEDYAIAIVDVREIIQYETVTRVPTTPPWIRGVINLRSHAVPVVDLAVKFGLPETPVRPQTCIVVVEVAPSGPGLVMGVMAESVQQVVDLGEEEIEAPPAFGTQVRVDYLAGMGKVGQGLVLMLDTERVLTADELLAATAVVDAVTGAPDSPEAIPTRQ